MSPTPQRGTPAADAFLAIQQHARRNQLDVQEQLTLYALEGLLARLAVSPHREDFVLKGGVLLAAFRLRRPTKDIDLQATGLPSEVEAVVSRFRAIAAIDLPDGLEFPNSSITAQTIREADAYNGVRVKLTGRLVRARMSIGIDVNFGDPIWPRPVEIALPRLVQIGQEPVELLGFPLPMVVAEKAVTVLQRGAANTRWRDFADLLTISRNHRFAVTELRRALETVAAYRAVELRPILPDLAAMPPRAQAKWGVWRRRQAHGASLPERFEEVLKQTAVFLDPVLDGGRPGSGEWSPGTTEWTRH